MQIQTVTKATAFSPGKNAWVLPDLDQSKWTRKVDWYLNFIISRAHKHSTKRFDAKLESILSQHELPIKPIQIAENAPYLLGNMDRLPNHQTVVLNYQDDISTWIKDIHKIWLNLKQPSLRIFLPIDITADEFKKHWPQSDNSMSVEIVTFDK